MNKAEIADWTNVVAFPRPSGRPEIVGDESAVVFREGPTHDHREPMASVGSRLSEQVGELVAAFAKAMPAVKEAFVRRDGTEFLLLGDTWDNEAEENAAALSVALQRVFAPSFSPRIDGAFEPRSAQPLGDYTRVFSR